MSYSQFTPLKMSTSHAFAGTAMQGSLTQELVILVILVVIALALIFICGWMGKRTESEEPAEESKVQAVPAAHPQVKAAIPAAGIAMTEAISEEAVEQPEQAAIEPIEAATEAEELETAVEMAGQVAEMEAFKPVVTGAVEIAEPLPVTPSKPDDLKIVEGIGPKVSQLLNAAGIFTFAQLADASVDHLQEIVDAARLRMMDPTSWPDQARLAAAGDWDGLKKLQDELKGGRHV